MTIEGNTAGQDVRLYAEELTREQLIAELVSAAEGRDEAEELIESLSEDISVLDRAVSSHPAAIETYNTLLLDPLPEAPIAAKHLNSLPWASVLSQRLSVCHR